MAESEAAFRLLEMDQHHAKARWFNMLFVRWRKETLPDAYRNISKAVVALASVYPKTVGILQVVESEALPPSQEARSEFPLLVKTIGPHVKHYSILHEGSGFKAASVRAVVAGVHMLSRPPFEHAVHSSLVEAASWHARHQRALGRQDTAEQIVRIVRHLRQLHDKYVSTE